MGGVPGLLMAFVFAYGTLTIKIMLLKCLVFSYFPFGFEGWMWDLIVSVPDQCLSFYFRYLKKKKTMFLT